MSTQETVPKLLLTIPEVAHTTGISESTLYRLMAKDKLPVVRIGGVTRVRWVDLEAFVNAHLQRPANEVVS